MGSQISNELGRLIQRHISAGHKPEEVIHEIYEALRELEEGTQQTNAMPSRVDSVHKRLPDPPQLDEMISPPFDLPRLGPSFDTHVNWGGSRLPDPLPE